MVLEKTQWVNSSPNTKTYCATDIPIDMPVVMLWVIRLLIN